MTETRLVDRITPKAGFLQRRLQEFIRSRAGPGDPGICWFCRHRVWWRPLALPDVLRCGSCSPPVPGLAVEWIGEPSGRSPGGAVG